MRDDILSLIEQEQDVTNMIVLTHNIDFVILQSLLLPVMKKIGNPKLTVFADSHCASESFNRLRSVIVGLGTRYRVVKIAMEPGFRFHSKAVLLSGPERATLWIGSGNLTFGGWRENAEVWRQFKTDADGTGAFKGLKDYLYYLMKLKHLSESVKTEVYEAFDEKTHQWATSMDDAKYLLGVPTQQQLSLLQQIKNNIGNKKVEQLIVCSPYFDDDGKALSKLANELKAKKVEVMVQSGYSGLKKSIAKKLPPSSSLKSINYNFKDREGESAFIHAKFYGLVHGKDVTVITGSANCSNAALNIPGEEGNAELVVIESMNLAEFESNYLSEFEVVKGEIDLPEEIEYEDTNDTNFINIMSAQLNYDELQITYTCSGDINITACFLDKEKNEVHIEDPGLIKLKLIEAPRIVWLEGKGKKGQIVESSPLWVDHEDKLSASAHGRSLVDEVREKAKKGVWNIEVFADVLKFFKDDVEYTPERKITLEKKDSPDEIEANDKEYSFNDIFIDGYRLPSPKAYISGHHTEVGIQGLHKMVLRWLGYSYSAIDEEDNGSLGGESPDENPLSKSVRRTTNKEKESYGDLNTDEREKFRKKVISLLTDLADVMSGQEYLHNRLPARMAADVKIAALLLRSGLLEGWITTDGFFKFTHKVWLPFFFTSEMDQDKGWIEYRIYQGEKDNFIKSFSSPAMSAALIVWSATAESAKDSFEYNRFSLACVLSAARMPWLWQGGSTEDIAKEVALLLKSGKHRMNDTDSIWDSIEKHWLTMMRRGKALSVAERFLKQIEPSDTKDNIKQINIQAGELLWQKQLCVSKDSFTRLPSKNIKVVSLQKLDELSFKSDYVIPLQALLKETTITEMKGLERKYRSVIEEMSVEFIDRFKWS